MSTSTSQAPSTLIPAGHLQPADTSRLQDSTPTLGIGATLRITNPDLPPELAARRDQHSPPSRRGTQRAREGTPQPLVTWLSPPETDKLTLSIGGPLRIANPDLPPEFTARRSSLSSRRGHDVADNARGGSPQPSDPSFSPVETDKLMLSIGGPLRVTNPDLSHKSASWRGKYSSKSRRDRTVAGKAREGSSHPPIPSLSPPIPEESTSDVRAPLRVINPDIPLKLGHRCDSYTSRSRQGYNPAGEARESSPTPPIPPFSSTQTEKSQPPPLADDQFPVTEEQIPIEQKVKFEKTFHQRVVRAYGDGQEGAAGRKGEGRRSRNSRAGKQGQEAGNEDEVSGAREQELKKREEEVKRKELELMRNEESAKRRDAEIRRREEGLEEAICRFEEERKEENLKEAKLREKIRRLEEERKDTGRKEEELRKETRRLEAKRAEVRQIEEELRKREEEVQRRESEINARRNQQEAGFHKREEQNHCQERAREADWRLHREQEKPDLPLSVDDKGYFKEIGDRNVEQRKLDEIWEQEPIGKAKRKQEELQGADQQMKECMHPEQTNTQEFAIVPSSQPFSWTSPRVQTWGSYRLSFFSARTSIASYSTTLEHTDGGMTDWQRRQEEMYQEQREQFRQEQERLESFKQPCGLGWMLNTS